MSNLKKRKFPTLIIAPFACAVIALSIVGFYNAELLLPLRHSSSPAPLFDPHFSSLLGGRCNCTLDYVVADRAIRPNMSCTCVRENCSPIVLTETIKVMPPIADMVREIVKEVAQSGNFSSAMGLDKKKPKEEKSEAPIVKKVVQYKPWYVQNRTWHYPALFPLCTMDSCFNFSKCEDMNELKIFTYDSPSPPVRYFTKINETEYFTNDPDKACLLFVFLDGPGPWNPHPSELPHWNGGLNHVLITFADLWKQKGPPQDSIGMAAVMASNIHETTYRAGFDVSIPLPGKHHLHEYLDLQPFERKYFLTFRGLRYLGTRGEGVLRSHHSFRNLHNGEDIIVATSCKHSTNDLTRQRDPALGAHCDEDGKIHAATSFNDLMNSTFGLVPAGIQPSSYRFIEVLSAGSIPVLIADNYVKPFDTLIHWYKCLIQFPSTEMHRIVQSLRAISKEDVVKRQRHCIDIYKEFLQDDNTLLRSSIRALKVRFMGVFPALVESLS